MTSLLNTVLEKENVKPNKFLKSFAASVLKADKFYVKIGSSNISSFICPKMLTLSSALFNNEINNINNKFPFFIFILKMIK